MCLCIYVLCFIFIFFLYSVKKSINKFLSRFVNFRYSSFYSFVCLCFFSFFGYIKNLYFFFFDRLLYKKCFYFSFFFDLNIFYSFDHKKIGLFYILFGFFFGILGFYLSGFMRVSLMVPGFNVFSGSFVVYNVCVTSHGIIMIFFAAMPVFISGFGNFFVPSMVGSKDMAFPKLNIISFFLFLFSFVLFTFSCGSFFFSGFLGVGAGWTLYAPLSVYFVDGSIFFFILSLHVNGISSLLNALNSIATIQNNSSINRWHFGTFSWSILIVSYLLLFVLPVLVISITFLLSDSILSTCFYSVSGGGDPILFQHLFWFFGHPEVYILILPAFGILSELLSDFKGSKIDGYSTMVWSMIGIAVLGCFVWGHHMYTTGFELDSLCYFMVSTSFIGAPTGLKVFLWFCSFINHFMRFSVPIVFSVLFILTFSFGGVTGVCLSQYGFDLLLHDTYFVVGHFHYILAVCLLYVFFASFYHYFYFFTSFNYNEFFARIHLYTFFLGSNFLFFPMHILGFFGMQRRVFDYPYIFFFWNYVGTFGYFLIVFSFLWFIFSFCFVFSRH